jgi:hypothetical protein
LEGKVVVGLDEGRGDYIHSAAAFGSTWL